MILTHRGSSAMGLLDQFKSKLMAAASQLSQAGTEMRVEMQFDRVRQRIAAEPSHVPDPETISALREIVRVDSRIVPEARRLLAEQLLAQGNATEAAQQLQAAIAFMSEEVPVTTREWLALHLNTAPEDYLCELFNQLASLYAQQKQWNNAIATAQQAVSLNDRDLTAYHTWATCLLAQGLEDEAYSVLRRARAFDNLGLVDTWLEEIERSSHQTCHPPTEGE